MAKPKIPRTHRARRKTERAGDAPQPASADAAAEARERLLRGSGGHRDAKALYDRAPALGAEAMVTLHRVMWGELMLCRRTVTAALADMQRAIKALEDGPDKITLQGRLVRLRMQATGQLKQIADALIGLSKLHLDADLDQAFAEITITTDAWRDGMLTTRPPPPPPLDDDGTDAVD